ncbi:WXG100-like domain-containing protein [Sphaerisporangium sp. NPDC004334]
MAHGGNPNVNPNTPGGQASPGIGGTSSTDVTPAWGESLPGWVDTFIAMIAAGQSWPRASESLLWELAKEHQALGGGLQESVDPGIAAGRAVLAGWQVPATPLYVEQADQVLKGDGGVLGLALAHQAKALQVDDFARETQYSKISINVAFWVGVTAAAIALLSMGAGVPLLGPIAASTRAAIWRILQRLAAVAGRDLGAGVTARLAAGRLAQTGAQSLARTMLASHLGREIIEEIGEEVFIDAYSQHKQMEMGTRTSWDWSKTSASAIGAGGGAVAGMKVAAPLLSRYGGRVPMLNRLDDLARNGSGASSRLAGFGRDAMQTGLNNMVASPAGSFLANGVVYNEWNPLTALGPDALAGAFMGGAGRTRTISPFNPDVFHAVTHPAQTLHAATTADAQARATTLSSTAPATNPSPAPGAAPPSVSNPASSSPASSGPAASSNAGPAGPSGTGTGQPLTGSSGQSPAPPGGAAPPATLSTGNPPPSGTAQPAQTSGTGQSAQTGGTSQPAQTGGTGQATQSGGTGQPNQTGGTGQPNQTAGTGQPHQTGGTGQPNQTAGTGQPHQTGGTGQAAQTGGTGHSAQSSAASQSNQTGPGSPPPPGTGTGQSAPSPQGLDPHAQASSQQAPPPTTAAPSGTTPPGAGTIAAGPVPGDPSASGPVPGTPNVTGPGTPNASAPVPGTPNVPGPGAPNASAPVPGAPNASAPPGSPSPAPAGTGVPATSGATPAAGVAPATGVVPAGGPGPAVAAAGPAPLFMPGMPSVQVTPAATPSQVTPSGIPPRTTPAGTAPPAAAGGAPSVRTTPAGTPPQVAPGAAPTAQTTPTGTPPQVAPGAAPSVQTTPAGTPSQVGAGGVPPVSGGGTSAAGAASPDPAHTVTAVLSDMLPLVDPDALPLDDGSLRVTGPDGRPHLVRADAVRRMTRNLGVRVMDGVQDQRLRAEAAARLGAAISRSAGLPPMAGSLNALGRLADASPGALDVLADVAREVVGDRWGRLRATDLTEAAHRVVKEANGGLPEESSGYDVMRTGPLDEQRKAVSERAATLADDLAATAAQTTSTGTGAGTGTTTQATPAPAGAAPTPVAPATPSALAPTGTSTPTGSQAAPASTGSTRTSTGPQAAPAVAGTNALSAVPASGGPSTTAQAGTNATAQAGTNANLGQVVPGGGETRPAQGVVRRFLGAALNPFSSRGGALAPNVEARYAEYRHLAERWSQAAPDQRDHYESQIRTLITRLSDQGHPAPVPPWDTGRFHTVVPTTIAQTQPVQATLTQATPAQGTQTQGTPAGSQGQGALSQGNPAQGTQAQGTRPSATPAQGTRAQGTQPSGTPAQGAQAGVALPGPLVELVERVERVRESLRQVEDGQRAREAANRKRAEDAAERAGTAHDNAEKADAEEDAWHVDRARDARSTKRLEEIAAEHYGRIADAYGEAAVRAQEVAAAYARVAETLERLAATQTSASPAQTSATPVQASASPTHTSTSPAQASATPAQTSASPTHASASPAQASASPAQASASSVSDLVARVAEQVREADAAFERYREAVKAARPPDAVLPVGVPSGRLPYLTRLTNAVNQVLADRGVDERVRPAELMWTLRADFQQLASPDGVVLRFGHGTAGEVRIRLEMGEPVEVPDPGRVSSEMMQGLLPQGGSWMAATVVRMLSASFGLNLATVAALATPGGGLVGLLGGLAKYVGLSVRHNVGRSSTTTGSHAEYVLPGQVADNRGDATLFHVPVAYTVDARVPGGRGGSPEWTAAARVTEGAGNDKTGLDLWLSHAHTEHPPDAPFRLPEDQVGDARFPRYVPLHTEGLERLADEAVATEGTDGRPLRRATRDQVRAIITQELPGHLTEAVDDEQGFVRIITDGGRSGVLRVRSRVVSESMASRPGWKQFQEWLGVSFSGATGAMSAGRSSGLGTTGGVGLTDDTAPSNGWHGLGVRLNAGFRRAWSRSDGVSAGGVSIYPLVRRWMGRTNLQDVTLHHDVTVYFFDEGGPRPEVSGDTRMLLQVPEPDAGRAGWAVDADAPSRDEAGEQRANADGSPRFRDDPDPAPPPGRTTDAPVWMGSNADQMRGAGPSTVYLDAVEVHRRREEVMRNLRAAGLLPGIGPDGLPRPSLDPLERDAQLANLREVTEQFSVNALQTRIDQAAQDGVHLDLVRARLGESIRHYTLRVSLVDTGRSDYAGWSEAEGHVALNISSNTTVRSRSRSRTWIASLSFAFKPLVKLAAKLGKHWTGAEFGWEGGMSRSTGWGSGYTLNEVTLIEGTPVAEFRRAYTMRADLVEKGRTRSLLSPESLSAPVSARMLVPADLLAQRQAVTSPVAPHPTTPELIRRSILLNMDLRDVLPAMLNVVPEAARADAETRHMLAALANVRTIISDTSWLGGEQRADFLVRAEGARPRRGWVAVRVELGESEWVAVNNLTTADIHLALSSTSANSGGSHSNAVNASAGAAGRLAADLGGGVNGSATRNAGHSTGRTLIAGDEPIIVDTGKQYGYRVPVTVYVTGGMEGSETRPPEVVPNGSIMYDLPEQDALTLYGHGEMPLPLHAVADAMERFLNGHLKFDAPMAMRLARQYVKDRQAALADPNPPDIPLLAKHTPEALFEGISARLLKELNKPAADLDDLLDPARTAQNVRVAMPVYSQNRLGTTAIKSIRLRTADGRAVEVLDAVVDQVLAAVPNARLTDPVMIRALVGMFAGDNWWGTIENQLSPHGFEWEMPVRVGRHKTKLVRITLRSGFDGDTVEREGRNDAKVFIRQKYGYESVEESASAGSSFGAGANGGVSVGGNGGKASAGSHRGHTRSTSRGVQLTQLYGVASFDGGDLVSHPVTVAVSAKVVPMPPGRSGNRLTQPVRSLFQRTGSAVYRGVARGARTVAGVLPWVRPVAPILADPAPLVLTGTAVRLVEDGLTVPADQVPAPTPRVPDPRPLELPEAIFPVETVADGLIDAVRARLARPDLLGPVGVQEQWTRIAHALSRMALNANLELITSPDGHPVLRVPMHGNKVVDVWIHATPSEEEMVVGERQNLENRQVKRRQETYGTASERNRLSPASRGVEGAQDGWGTGQGVSTGDQAGQRVSSSGGARKEKSGFEKGPAVTLSTRLDLAVSFRVSTVRNDGGERPGRVVELPGSVTGHAVVMMATRDYEAMLRRRRHEPGRGWSFDDDGSSAERRPRRRRPLAGRAPWTSAGRGPATLDQVVDAARSRPEFATAPIRAVAEELRGRLPRPGSGEALTLSTSARPADLPIPLAWARLLARELRVDVRIDVQEPGGLVRGYTADTRGRLAGDIPDGGFAAALAALPTEVAATAVAHGLDLRPLFNRTAVRGDFAEQVTAELETLGATVPQRPAPIFPRPLWGPGPEESANTMLGSLGVRAPVDPGSGFVRGRAPESGPLDEAELRTAWQDVQADDLGVDVRASAWPDGDPVLTVTTGGPLGEVRFRPEVAGVPADRMASTDLDSGSPYVVRIDPDTPAHLVARTLVHEVGHAIRELAARAGGAPQGVLRPSLAAASPAGAPVPTTDACAEARVDEYRYLSRKWTQAPADRRPGLRAQIEGLARLVEGRGLTPPPPPWSGPPPSVPRQRPSIGSLLNASTPPGPAAGPPPASTGPANAPANGTTAGPAAGNGTAAAPSAGNGAGNGPAGGGTPAAGESRQEFWARMRRMSNTTGWIPPEEDPLRRPAPSPSGSASAPARPPSPVPTAPPSSSAVFRPSSSTPPRSPSPFASPPDLGEPAGRPVKVRHDDTLTTIARRWLGPGATDGEVARAARDWYQANRDLIGDDPDLLTPGQTLTPPTRGSKV